MAKSGGEELPGKLTKQVVICTAIAAAGGLMFGYDIGISGGVTSMDSFLKEFFPTVYVKKHAAKSNNYCKYNNPYLQLFTSSLYLAGIVSSCCASFVCRRFGRRPSMQIASAFFLVGAILNAAANNLGMLIAGRLCLGAGIGFGNQAVPLFISEIAPAKYRGGLNICFQFLITIGILIANLTNYVTLKIHPYGWRISLGGAAIPALILLVGSFSIVETPTSLLEQGKKKEAMETLKQVRGLDNVDQEFGEIAAAAYSAKQVKHPFRTVLSRSSRPQLICAMLMQAFQQLTGISIIMLYSPVIFQTMGFKDNASILSAVLTNTIKPLCTVVAILAVDRFGRRILLTEAAFQMLIAMCGIGGILAAQLHTVNVLPKSDSIGVIILICVFLAGFAWSWGPLGWLVPSEIFPLETRTAGFFFAVSTNMMFTFLVAQTFTTMLCHLRAGTFFFFAAWLLIMGLFAIFLLPETKGVPIDEMVDRVWKKHWLWKRYYDDEDVPRSATTEAIC